MQSVGSVFMLPFFFAGKPLRVTKLLKSTKKIQRHMKGRQLLKIHLEFTIMLNQDLTLHSHPWSLTILLSEKSSLSAQAVQKHPKAIIHLPSMLEPMLMVFIMMFALEHLYRRSTALLIREFPGRTFFKAIQLTNVCSNTVSETCRNWFVFLSGQRTVLGYMLIKDSSDQILSPFQRIQLSGPYYMISFFKFLLLSLQPFFLIEVEFKHYLS